MRKKTYVTIMMILWLFPVISSYGQEYGYPNQDRYGYPIASFSELNYNTHIYSSGKDFAVSYSDYDVRNRVKTFKTLLGALSFATNRHLFAPVLPMEKFLDTHKNVYKFDVSDAEEIKKHITCDNGELWLSRIKKGDKYKIQGFASKTSSRSVSFYGVCDNRVSAIQLAQVTEAYLKSFLCQ